MRDAPCQVPKFRRWSSRPWTSAVVRLRIGDVLVMGI